MSAFENPNFDDHESVSFFAEPAAGLRALIAVHSTALGPGAGGVRFWRYATSADALTDVLRLSRGMSFKNAMADLPLGGGKAVVMKPEGDFDRPALFEAYGRCVEALGGRYITAEDVGVGVEDMAAVRRATAHVGGLSEGKAASGDPSPVTARGVFLGIKTVARRALGRDDLEGVTVAVQGVGHVGAGVCRLLKAAGASLIVSDVNADAVAAVAQELGARVVAPEAIYGVEADIFSPCALGAIVNPSTIDRLKVKAIAGGANNQLSTPDMGDRLMERGIVYAPDYVINSGGIINIAAEVAGRESGRYDPAWVEAKVLASNKTLEAVFDRAAAEGRPTHAVADEMAKERIAMGRRARS
jgi:leucine dehydrogenase